MVKSILGLPDALSFNFLQLHPDVHELNTKKKPSHIPTDVWESYNDLFTYKKEAQPGSRSCDQTPDANTPWHRW